MKKVLFHLIAICFCSAMTHAGFTYTISSTYEYAVELVGDESLLVTGGGADQIDAYDDSYIEVQGTGPLQLDVGGIGILLLNDNSTMNFYNGELGSFRIYDNAEAIFRGGRIDYIRSYQSITGGPHIEIICRNYTATSTLVTGTWNADNDNNGQWDTFSIQLLNQSGYAPVLSNIKFTEIPEPATLLLLGLGGLLITRRQARV